MIEVNFIPTIHYAQRPIGIIASSDEVQADFTITVDAVDSNAEMQKQAKEKLLTFLDSLINDLRDS
ncbi:hypothetical protein [Psychrobacter sp. JB193]|uniref:hypothetical protein n=1 Tax=Psychrobacter sp. JB193 TaxID=2024406 RepID=UPI000BAAABC2|nr:hypothetical protein [Psychrobacter sp. JB193]PAT63964.1 hypothetical protein CIK80_02300 [Psychrobacter sp. JB193]